jgi:hypothetical protein
MLAAAAQSNGTDVLSLILGIGPYGLLAIFATMYFIIQVKFNKGSRTPGYVKYGFPVLFMLLGHLATPGNTIDSFLPQLFAGLFNNHVTFH